MHAVEVARVDFQDRKPCDLNETGYALMEFIIPSFKPAIERAVSSMRSAWSGIAYSNGLSELLSAYEP